MPRCAAKLPWGYDERNTEQVPSPDPYQQLQYANLPAALLGTLKRDKKPFTYTPGGVNLSEVLEARLQKRLERKKKYMEEMEQEQQNPRLLVVAPTYNSPLNMYSMENALETLEVQAKMATNSRSPSLTLPRNYKFKFQEEEDFEPSQSKAFRVLQVMTDTEPHSGDKRVKNSQTVSAMRFTGLREGKPSNPSKFFHALQKITGTEEEEEVQEDEDYLGDVPIENPDLLGGDILGFEDAQDRNAIVNKLQLWPGGIVPYVADPALQATVFKLTLQGAFDQYKRDTCIRFVPRTTEKDYIRLFPGEGCYSHVGRTGGQQPVSLGQGCGWMGTIVHELGHAIGFYHEQNRSDRDDHLIIFWENVKEGMEDQFFKLQPHQNQLLTPFDYDSIMLYGSYTFSKDRKKLKTMVGKKNNQFLQEVISKYRMSKSDLLRVNTLYNCNDKTR